ncbi:VOC family protein [Oceanicella sp. SM1341]|uniref:VOC family protein n=1 Tax=Oceanicella sp. SM1341 TaxID=1548889 RepID=UPI000E4A854C|nr:VOC family protein [Oceanicella sp. SM1341]
MFSHVMIGARDVPRMVAFYDRVLAHVGLRRSTPADASDPAGALWQGEGRWPQFALRPPFDGRPASAGNGVQIGFRCPGPEAVRAAWEEGLALGGTDEGAPGPRPRYAPDFHAAYLRDPEGNKLCFVWAGDAAPGDAGAR